MISLPPQRPGRGSKEEGKEEQDGDVLKEKIKDIKDGFKQLKKERGTAKATLKREKPIKKIEEMIGKLTERIKTTKLQMEDRDEGKEVALGTSKINYLDPRFVPLLSPSKNIYLINHQDHCFLV